ncbi:MAG: hypothetical protein ABIJ96_14140 [Elusimicrobiota bacterium]
MALLLKHWRRALAAALASFTIWTLWLGRGAPTCAVIVDARELGELCAPVCAETGVLERLHTMGAAGVLLHPQSLESRIRAGDILRYTEQEISKLRATQVASAGAPLEPGALWIRDDAMLARVQDAAAAHRLPMTLRTFADQKVAVLAPGKAGKNFSVGYDPLLAASVRRHGLKTVCLVRSMPELRLAEGRAAAALLAPGFAAEAGVPAGINIVAFANAGPGSAGPLGSARRAVRAEFLAAAGTAAARLAAAGEARVADGLGAFLREASRRGNALVVARLDMDRSLEDNLAALRGLLKELRRNGYAPRLEGGLLTASGGGRAAAAVRSSAGFCLTVLGPLLAMRWGIGVLRGMQEAGRLPEASPFREVLAAAGTAAAAAAGFGAASYACMSFSAWRLGATRFDWLPWAEGLTFVLAALALYDPDPRALSLFFRKKVGRASELRVALPVAAATLLLLSPDWLRDWGPEAWLAGLRYADESLWWAAARWREWLVGYPCLLVGLCLLFSRFAARRHKDLEAPDPRGWLLLGMFAPTGLAGVLAAAHTPIITLLSHSLQGALAGLPLGLLLLGARHGALRRLVKISDL